MGSVTSASGACVRASQGPTDCPCRIEPEMRPLSGLSATSGPPCSWCGSLVTVAAEYLHCCSFVCTVKGQKRPSLKYVLAYSSGWCLPVGSAVCVLNYMRVNFGNGFSSFKAKVHFYKDKWSRLGS